MTIIKVFLLVLLGLVDVHFSVRISFGLTLGNWVDWKNFLTQDRTDVLNSNLAHLVTNEKQEFTSLSVVICVDGCDG